MSQVFTCKPLSSMPADFVPASGFRAVRLIYKHTDKQKETGIPKTESQYVVLPEVSTQLVEAFRLNESGLELLKDYLGELQRACCHKVWAEHRRSPCDADLSIEQLIEAGKAVQSEGFRLSAKLIGEVFSSNWRSQVEAGLAITRSVEFATAVEANDAAAIHAFWQSEAGMQFRTIAQNYGKLYQRAAERTGSYDSEAQKEKVLASLEYVEDTGAVWARVSEKLRSMPVATPDNLAL